MRYNSICKRQAGFTLTELTVALIIFSVISGYLFNAFLKLNHEFNLGYYKEQYVDSAQKTLTNLSVDLKNALNKDLLLTRSDRLRIRNDRGIRSYVYINGDLFVNGLRTNTRLSGAPFRYYDARKNPVHDAEDIRLVECVIASAFNGENVHISRIYHVPETR